MKYDFFTFITCIYTSNPDLFVAVTRWWTAKAAGLEAGSPDSGWQRPLW